MSVGYTRQSAGTILTGNTIQASDFNAEYNLLETAFSVASGHNHDGTTGGGAKIPVAGLSGLTSTSAGILVADGANGYALRTLTAPAAGITVTNGTGVSGNPTLALANDLAALEGLSGTGVAVRTGTSTWTNRTITAGSNISVTNGDGVSGNPTIALTGIGSTIQAYDATLDAFAAYNTNGLLTQTSANTFTGRTLTGTTNRITVTNGDGVSGNPTVDISSSYVGQNTITTLGTITTGTWNGTTLAIANGGTGQTTANAALNALLPNQATHAGKYLTTDGTNTSWGTPATGSSGVADPGGNGVMVRTALNTSVNRTITGTAGTITVTNGNGVSGNPTLTIDSGYIGQTSITTLGTITTGTWNGTTIARANGGTGLTTAGTAGNILTSDGTNWVSSPPANTGTVTSVAAGDGLSGGTITSSGTISINTNNSLGVGAYALLRYQVSGGTILDGSTVSGANLEIAKFGTGGSISASGNPSGTWRNVSGTSLINGGGTSGEYGIFIRTA